MSVAATAGGLPTRLGKYEILTPIASGGMARIYIGRSTGIGSFERHVVLKMILPERAQDETSVQMFLDEARLAASLNHQNVAQVFEVGQDAGIHFLAMEYVHGQDLRALLAKAGSTGTRVPLELALTVVAGAASGLHHAHERRTSDGVPMGIVHRDVSPSNIMIGYDGAVKLLDFGIAKATLRSIETQSGIIKGKFAYMAPEQCRGRDVDRRGDVFSLGIILYEVTTQHRCFRADSDFDTMHRIVTGDIVRPTRLVQGYPQALEAIVMKALATDANQRYQTSGMLLEAVESFAVASRMSLSTMSLGRFMRDLFGEVQEPWLVVGRSGLPVPAKEQTISNTNASSDHGERPLPPMEHEQAPMHLPPEPLEGVSGASGDPGALGAAPMYPYPPAVLPMDPRSSSPDLRLASPDPRLSSPDLLMPSPDVAQMSPYASIARPGMAGGSQPMLPFGVQPGSGSGPAHPALPSFVPPGVGPSFGPVGSQPIARTHRGYANAPGASRSDISQQRYAPSYGMSLQPHNRLLYIGLGVLLVGIIVLLAIVILDGSDDLPAPPPRQPSVAPVKQGSSQPATPATRAAGTPGAAGPRVLTPEPVKPEAFRPDASHASAAVPAAGHAASVSLHVVSIPPGAQVLLAGKLLGTTPLSALVPRAAAAQLIVRRAHYEDMTVNVDLGGDIEKQVTLAALPDGATPRPPATHDAPLSVPTVPSAQGAQGAASGPTAPSVPRDRNDRPSRPASRDTRPRANDAAPRCQPADQVNPFDTTCDGKACPPCDRSGAPRTR